MNHFSQRNVYLQIPITNLSEKWPSTMCRGASKEVYIKSDFITHNWFICGEPYLIDNTRRFVRIWYEMKKNVENWNNMFWELKVILIECCGGEVLSKKLPLSMIAELSSSRM
jgi:hypothetical protein